MSPAQKRAKSKKRSFSPKDGSFMERAFCLSEKGLGWVNPNPTVGAVLVKGNQVIGEGYHPKVGEAHAEIKAIKNAKRKGHRVKGATLYVTLEPCCHHGRTPPCTEAIVKAGLKRVVISEKDPNPKVSGQGVQFLRRNGIDVQVGFQRDKALEHNLIYRHWITHKRPLVTLKMSVSLDGKISPAKKEKGKVFYVIGEKSLKRVHEMRHRYDAILIGVNTLLQDNPLLTTRIKGKKIVRHPRPIILDSKAKTPLQSKILKPISNRNLPLIVVGKDASPHRIQQLQDKGAEVLSIPSNDYGLDLNLLLDHLALKEVTGVMVEGGSQVAESFYRQNLIDRMELALAPIIIGSQGIPMFFPSKNGLIADHFPRLHSLKVENLDSDLWVSGFLS